MSHLLFYYQRPEPATWVFLSSFLLLSIYFVFHRFFCVRNLDIVLLVLRAPGLMMVYEGRRMQLAHETSVSTEVLARNPKHVSASFAALIRPTVPISAEQATKKSMSQADQADGFIQTKLPVTELTLQESLLGEEPATNDRIGRYPDEQVKKAAAAESLEFYGFIALLLACMLLMTRMLIDPALVRRPLLVPNLSIGGLSFIGVSLFLFLMGNVITSTPLEQQQRGPALGPGYALLNMLPELPTTPDTELNESDLSSQDSGRIWLPNVARIIAIFSNFAIVLGIIGVGYWHFDNVKTGIGCAVMYLLLPYTAQMTGNLEHVLPAALLVLALLAYRQPLIAGVLLGLAAGFVYYPLFLLPLWFSFYWYRGLTSLVIGVCSSLALLSGLLLLEGTEAFFDHLRWMYGLWLPRMEGLVGVWGPGRFQPDYRLPVLVAFILLAGSFVFWPPRKNLGTLICGTAAIMLAAQFWHGNGGGLFMAWFLPFVMLTIFRPNLDDRIATQVVRAGKAAKLNASN